jgi:hypothetical protein
MAKDAASEGKDPRKAWDQVGQHFSDVGRRISEHYREERGETGSASAQRRAVNDAIRRVVDQLDQTFTSLGNALRDPETNEGLKRAGRSLSEALDATFSGLGGEIKRRIGRRGSGTDAGSP